jgi:hypothetical protein
MERILTIENGDVKFQREELQLIPEFAALLALKYNKRLRAVAELKYMWFMYSHLSPYREYSDSERHEESCIVAELERDFKVSDELKAAIIKYTSLNTSRILKLIRAAEKAIDKLREYFENVDFTLKDDKGTLVYKPSEVIRAITDLDKVATGLDKLAQRVQNEKKEGSATRGAQEDGWIMDNDDYGRTRDNSAGNSREEEDS